MPDVNNPNASIGQQNINSPVYNVYGDRKIPRQLTTATAAVPPTFLGREQELDDIRALLTQRSTIALVNSEGGMGKTTLAARYWERYQHEYKHLAWLFCEKGILAAMRDHLPQPLELVEAMNQCADDPDKQAEIIKTALANLEKDCLLVFDNANEPEHIHGFLQYMNGLGWHVLITSRCSKVLPDADSEYPITHLPSDLAKELFRKNYEEDSPQFDALLDRFLNAVGYNTLCTEVFSKNLREGAAWGLTFEKLLAQLEKNGLFLGDDSFEIQTDYAHNVKKETVKSTDQIIEALYNVADLQQRNPELHDLLLQFALLPVGNHAPTLLLELLSSENKNELKRQLDRLAQKGWLSTDTQTYRISPVMQKIVLQKNAARLWMLGEPMVEKLNAIFETEGYHSKNIATAAPFATLVFELVEHLNTANADLAVLYDRLWYYYTATGNLAKALETADRMRIFCEKFDFKNSLPFSYNKLGETYMALGNLPEALTFFEKDIELSKELHEAEPQNVSFKNGLAASYSKLGETHTALGNLPQGLDAYSMTNQMFEELHEAYPQNVSFKNSLAISYSKLGSTHTALGNLPQALTFFEQYNSLKKELHESFPQNVAFKNGLAISYSKLGETHSALGNLPQALTFFEQYNQLEKELYESYLQNVEFKNNLAISYQYLGITHSALGNLPKALTFFEQYNQLEKELHEAYPQNVEFKNNLAISCQYLGNTHRALGNLPQALTFFEKDIELSKELHEAFPQNVAFKNGLATSYLHLGQFFRDQKRDSQKAKEYIQKGYELYAELVRDFPDYTSFRRNYEWAKKALEGL